MSLPLPRPPQTKSQPDGRSRQSKQEGKSEPNRRSAVPANPPPIGVFDSGIGGLTVASALRNLLPAENIFYIGDTARVPYGGKSQQTIERYSVEITGLLLAEQAKMIVVACNTASALAIPRLQEILKVPVIGVIEPGAKAAVEASLTGRIGVIGTRATVYSRAYERAIQALNPEAQVISQACPMLVPLIEEGWLDDPITDQIIRRYLAKFIKANIDTLVLGCTHYPLLSNAIRKFTGSHVNLVDSAQNCAVAVKKLLAEDAIAAPKKNIGKLRVALTDKSDGFLRVAEEALALQVGDIEVRTVQK